MAITQEDHVRYQTGPFQPLAQAVEVVRLALNPFLYKVRFLSGARVRDAARSLQVDS